MKKTVIVIAVALAFIALTAVAVTSALYTFDHSDVKILTAERLEITTTDRLEMSVDFFVRKEIVDYLENNADTFKIFAIARNYDENMGEFNENSGPALTPSLVGTKEIDGIVHNVYRLSFGVIMPDKYMQPITYRAFISYKMASKNYVVSSDYSLDKNVVVPYDEVYSVYCDRSEIVTDDYPFSAGDGTYTRVKDIYTATKILTSYTYIEINEGKAVNIKENGIYTSPINQEYFDGVLTLYINGSDIPDWMIEKLYVNGEERYFEIYEGKIKLVV
jgi:hypothetical protein